MGHLPVPTNLLEVIKTKRLALLAGAGYAALLAYVFLYVEGFIPARAGCEPGEYLALVLDIPLNALNVEFYVMGALSVLAVTYIANAWGDL